MDVDDSGAQVVDADTDTVADDVQPDVEPDGGPDPENGTDTATPAEAEGEATTTRPSVVASLLARPGVLLAFYALVALVLTWPLVAHLTDALNQGTEPTATVPLFNLWTLQWNQVQVGELFADYWDAPLFHPVAGGFALSEPQPLTGLAFAPVAWLSGNPVLGYNLVSLAILTLNGAAGSRLARTLGLAPAPAALVGVLAVGLPFVAHQMGVLQLTVVFPLLLLMEAILRWAPAGGTWPAARIGIWLAVTFLTCGYYGLFAVVVFGLVSLVLARRSWLTRARLTDVAAAGGAFAVLALPILLGQARYTSEYDRPDEVIRDLSAGAGDYWQLDDEAQGAGIAPWLRDQTSGNGLYPGTALIGLGIAGLLLGGRRTRPADDRPEDGAPAPVAGASGANPSDAADAAAESPAGPGGPDAGDGSAGVGVPAGSTPLDEQRRPWFLFAGICLAWLLSRGLKLSVLGFQPYEVVRSVVPGYEELRSPFRFAVLAELCLLGLAAYGLNALWGWGRTVGRGRWRLTAGPVLATLLVVVAVAEVSVTPVELALPERTTPGWATWLEANARPPEDPEASPSGDRPVVAFAPFPMSGRAADFKPTVQRMIHALEAGLTTVNGYSGLFPEEHGELDAAMQDYPNERADELLRQYGVQYLVATSLWMEMDLSRWDWLVTRHSEVYGDGEVSIFELDFEPAPPS